jgi:hypothetical protein
VEQKIMNLRGWLPSEGRKWKALSLLFLGYIVCVPLVGMLQAGRIANWNAAGSYLLFVHGLFVAVMPVAFLMPVMRAVGLPYDWPEVVAAILVYWPLMAVLYRRFVKRNSWTCFWLIAGILFLTACGVLGVTVGALGT